MHRLTAELNAFAGVVIQFPAAQLDHDAGYFIRENQSLPRCGNAASDQRRAACIRMKFHRVRRGYPRDHHIQAVSNLQLATQRPNLNHAGILHGDGGARAGRRRRDPQRARLDAEGSAGIELRPALFKQQMILKYLRTRGPIEQDARTTSELQFRRSVLRLYDAALE